MLSLSLVVNMLTPLLITGLVSAAHAQYAGCPEPYGLQVYPHEQYCDKFYKCANGKNYCSTLISNFSHPLKNKVA